MAHEIHFRGGQERVTASLVEELLARGWDVTVVSRSCELASHPRLRVVTIPGPRRPALLGYIWFAAIGGVAVARHRTGVVHVNGIVVPNRADLATVHFCHRAFQDVRAEHRLRRSRRRTVPYLLNEIVTSWAFRLAERALYRPRRRGCLVGVSEGLAEELASCFPKMQGAIRTVPNGVDSEAFRPDPHARARVRTELGIASDQLVGVFVGGDWERKGLRFAIEALVDAPDWRLLVVGSGDPHLFGVLATELGVGSRVTFVGFKRETTEFYAAADALVLPTAYETSCLVALEAAASGLPVVVAPVSGFPQMLRSGIDGYVVPRDPAAIAGCLNELRDPERRKVMGAAGQELAVAARWESAADAYALIYGSIGEAA